MKRQYHDPDNGTRDVASKDEAYHMAKADGWAFFDTVITWVDGVIKNVTHSGASTVGRRNHYEDNEAGVTIVRKTERIE